MQRMGVVAVAAALAAGAAFGQGTESAYRDPDPVIRTAHQLFPEMPFLHPEPGVVGLCGADVTVHARMAYCTTTNTILYDPSFPADEAEHYEFAQLFGHAVQVRHGVADVALRAITSRRDEEAKLRGWVTRQATCIAGFIHAASGAAPFDLLSYYGGEPFTQAVWGRDPLAKGPRVSIGVEARQKWFDIGREGDLSACAVGEFGSELLVQALR